MGSPLPPAPGLGTNCGTPLSLVSQFCASCGAPRYGAGGPFAPIGKEFTESGGFPLLRGRKEGRSIPIGPWGYRQWAWVAAIAALDTKGPDFVVLLACSGVIPAEQMRYGTAEHLRRAHFGARSIRELLKLRTAFEEAL